MRNVLHGSAWFSPQDLEKVKHLMLLQCSATRTAYQYVQKTGVYGNPVKVHLKTRFGKELNQRYISDAAALASSQKNPGVVFGGKKAWQDLQHGRVTKEEWQLLRNRTLYASGDRAKKGNLNIRLEGDFLLVKDPTVRGLWIPGKLFVPEKFKHTFDPTCYDVRLQLKRDGSVQVTSTWEAEPRTIRPCCNDGTIGVDTNPDGCALVETDASGNLLHHHYESAQRLQFARHNKRANDVRLLAINVVNVALVANKPLILERLQFKKGKAGYRKFNRMTHNFLHKQILGAIKARAAKEGAEVIEIEPAFTSILGKLKYQDMYSLSIHCAAALVIARRGLGIQERQTFTVTGSGKGGGRQNLEGRCRTHTLTRKAWSWFQDCFLKPKNSLPHRDATGSDNSVGISGSLGENPKGESSTTTDRRGHLSS